MSRHVIVSLLAATLVGCSSSTPGSVQPEPKVTEPAPPPPQPLQVRWLINRLECGNPTDDFLKGKTDETYLIVALQGPGARAPGKPVRVPGNSNHYWRMKGKTHVDNIELFQGTLQPGEEVRISTTVLEDDNSGPAPKVINTLADAAAKDTSLAWAEPLLRVIGAAVGANKDDFIAGQVVRLRNVNGQLDVDVKHLAKDQHWVQNEGIDTRRGLQGTFRASFHKYPRWNYTMNSSVYVNGRMVEAR